ncbi:MAG: hypothetical protein ACXW5U_14050 [Thermoanaerobaculia bacterium]
MHATYRFGYRSLSALTSTNDPHGRITTQLNTAAELPQRLLAAGTFAWAQRTVALAVTAIALLCAVSVFADEPWSLDARSFHGEGFGAGVTTQSLMGGGLAPDPLAPDTGTVAYIIHTRGRASASLVVYDPATARYRHVATLLGPFENANDIESFDPLLRSVLRTVRERGFPARVADYTPDLRTMTWRSTTYPGRFRRRQGRRLHPRRRWHPRRTQRPSPRHPLRGRSRRSRR